MEDTKYSIRSRLISDFQSTISEIYIEEGLNCLDGLDGLYELEGINFLPRYSNLVNGFDNGENTLLDDLIFTSREIMYFIANMYLYKPYIVNPLLFGSFQGIFPYYPNIPTARYSMYTVIAAEKLYNFWDRVGDLIEMFFDKRLPKEKVYFGKVIDLAPETFKNNHHYKWLKNFKDSDYQSLNDKRKTLVHSCSEDANFRRVHLQNPTNSNELSKLQEERLNLTDFYKHQVSLTLKGFGETLSLLELVKSK